MVTRKAFITLGLICFLFIMIPSAAFSWSQATHAYISDWLWARMGHDNLNEMWGSVAPDMFIFDFDPTVCPDWITDQTHGTISSETFMKVWNAANTKFEDALAYGFVSHNEAWGADYTAHESGLTFGQDDGYVIAKAKLLLNTPYPASPELMFGEVFESFLGISSADQRLLVAHLITEYAVDILLGNDVDPFLGRKLATTARNVTRMFPALLIKAFAADYASHCYGGDLPAATRVLAAAEEDHRKNMIFLGQAISKPKPVAVQLLAEQVVSALSELLGGPLPISEAEAVKIVKTGIFESMAICHDYMAEIDATIEFVDKNLEEHGITIERRRSR